MITNLRAAEVPPMLIGELSRRTGCNIDTIRFYEKIGVLPRSARTEGNRRIYAAFHQQRLTFIRRSRELGFTLDEVRALLRLTDEQDQPCADVKELAAMHLMEVRSKIGDLHSMAAALEILIGECDQGVEASCPLIEALAANSANVDTDMPG